MVSIIFLGIPAGITVIVGVACFLLWREVSDDGRVMSIRTTFDAVSMHTYHPRHGKMPERGRLVLLVGWLLARHFQCPLFLNVGYTVPGEKRTEGEIYRDYAFEYMGREVDIKADCSADARDTNSEVKAAIGAARACGARTILAVGLQPHMYRIRRIWKDASAEDLSVSFFGVRCPFVWYVWEVFMIIAEMVFPPDSRRRSFVFNTIGRHG